MLHVFAPMGKALEAEYLKPPPSDAGGELLHELVGIICDYPVTLDDTGLGMAQRDFPGAKATFVVRAVYHSDGKRGAAIYLALWVDGMEAAQALPGFVPLFEYTGGFHIPKDGTVLSFRVQGNFGSV